MSKSGVHFFGASPIVRVDSLGNQSIVAQGGMLAGPDDSALGELGFLYVISQGRNSIIEVDLDTGFQRLVVSNGSSAGAYFLTAGGDGMLYAAVADRVVQIDPISGSESVVSSGNYLFDVRDIEYGFDGVLYVANYGGQNIVRVDPNTGAQIVISEGGELGSPWGLSMATDGLLYVNQLSGSSIVRVDPVTGAQTRLNPPDLLQAWGSTPAIPFSYEIPDPPPAVPACDASDGEPDGVHITWIDVDGETGYRIYRDGEPFIALAADVTTYLDTIGVGSYEYCVTAYNGAAESPPCCDQGTRRDYYKAPRLDFVSDVPNDQGGWVVLGWAGSEFDTPEFPIVTSYRIWRRIPPSAYQSAVSLSGSGDKRVSTQHAKFITRSDANGTLTYWEGIDNVPAYFLEGYGYTAPTVHDSLPWSNPHTAFFVRALTDDPFVFYDSEVDSGYSVDDLAPWPPNGLSGTYEPAVGVAMHWSPNREADLSGYAIYRGMTEDFEPSDENRLGTTADTSFVDPDGYFNYYKVSAIDIHYNESPFALLRSEDIPVQTLVKLFEIDDADGGVRLSLELGQNAATVSAMVLRGTSRELSQAVAITPNPIPITGATLDYLDRTAQPGSEYWYWVEIRDSERVLTVAGPVSVRTAQQTLTMTFMAPVQPNPTPGSAVFRYTVGSDIAGAGDAPVSLTIYDSRGRLVRALASGRQTVGEYAVEWDGRDNGGGLLSAGVYYYRFRAGTFDHRASIVLLR